MRFRDRYGEWWELSSLATTSEVLHLEALVTHDLKGAISRDEPIPATALLRLRDWLVSRVLTSPLPGWQEMEEEERREALDAELTFTEWMDCYRGLIEEASLPQETIEQLTGLLELAFDGGCECPSCAGKARHQDTLHPGCLLATFDTHIHHLLSLWLPVRDEPVLSQPYWLHQVKTIWGTIKGRQEAEARRKREEEREKEEEKKRVRKQMRQMGIR